MIDMVIVDLFKRKLIGTCPDLWVSAEIYKGVPISTKPIVSIFIANASGGAWSCIGDCVIYDSSIVAELKTIGGIETSFNDRDKVSFDLGDMDVLDRLFEYVVCRARECDGAFKRLRRKSWESRYK
jgi:hypothetical protein